ncbi:hypothetical protein [Methanobrevibacter sp.]|uniref:hypothetical protein n=1 Tax=Methanobrevibacter sp. TaxID=66852 RepID=UPI0026E0D69E|nr:hypothetical protein [Methanobrevibacter sp.]MDO5859238.1 hypothetical protein [Methanobrevibacter sp.]
MPYDLYDYFLKEKNNPIFTEVTDKVRENIWKESIAFITSIEWMTMENKMMVKLYYYLRYS